MPMPDDPFPLEFLLRISEELDAKPPSFPDQSPIVHELLEYLDDAPPRTRRTASSPCRGNSPIGLMQVAGS
jgi:hypothetical protein